MFYLNKIYCDRCNKHISRLERNNENMSEEEFYLQDLKSKFDKILKEE